jgi:hypothetical protein
MLKTHVVSKFPKHNFGFHHLAQEKQHVANTCCQHFPAVSPVPPCVETCGLQTLSDPSPAAHRLCCCCLPLAHQADGRLAFSLWVASHCTRNYEGYYRKLLKHVLGTFVRQFWYVLKTLLVPTTSKHKSGFQHIAQSFQTKCPTHAFNNFWQWPKYIFVRGIVMYKPSSRTATATPSGADHPSRHVDSCVQISHTLPKLAANTAVHTRRQDDPVQRTKKRDARRHGPWKVQPEPHLSTMPHVSPNPMRICYGEVDVSA